jgi:hypothetical protein
MANSVLIKTNLKGAIADAILNEINNKTSHFYYFLGRTQPWDVDFMPSAVLDSYKNELDTRSDIIYAKQINSNDASLVVRRIDWKVNTIYDAYDDQYSTALVGINLLSGGSGYTSAPAVNIVGTGTDARATATISVATGRVTGVTVTSGGSGYTNSTVNPLTISFTGGGGIGATASGVLAFAQNNVVRLEDSQFYVLTDDYNVYVCLDNNKGAISTEQPYGTSANPLKTSDGYVWKFLLTIPIALRTKFLTSKYIPIATSLKSQFYSSGEIRNIRIDSMGSGYDETTKLVVTGDGFSEANPYYVTGATIGTAGAGYTAATLQFSPPVKNSSAWASGRSYVVGQFISYQDNFYEVEVSGISNATPPTHQTGSVAQGAVVYRFAGMSAEATATVGSGAITAVSMLLGVRGVDVALPGTGYANGPNTMTFSDPAVTGVSYARDGKIYRVDITNNAYNQFTTLPTITSFGGGGTGATGVVLGQSGAGYQSAPTIEVTGTGTITTPAVLSSTAIKSEARIFPIISAGAIIGTVIADPGIGYNEASITVNGVGTGAELVPDLLFGDVSTLQSNTELTSVDGAIYSIPVVSGGYGYTTVPNVSIRGDGTGATAVAVISGGRVTSINVTIPGSGYKKAEIVITGGGGVGASARAIIPPYGGHSKNSVRSLFTRTLMFHSSVSKDLVNGIALEADYRQFGMIKNPYKYGSPIFATASTLSACWTVSPTTTVPASFVADTVLTVIPLTGSFNPTVVSAISGTQFTLSSVAGLVVGMPVAAPGAIQGTVITDITISTVTVSSPIAGVVNGSTLRFNFSVQYRVIHSTTSSIVLQSMNNAVPVTGDVFNFGGDSFSAATVTAPTLDKYSGDLLYQDNQIPFKPMDDTSEKITISTVFKF